MQKSGGCRRVSLGYLRPLSLPTALVPRYCRSCLRCVSYYHGAGWLADRW
jgi:hypothetical protein